MTISKMDRTGATVLAAALSATMAVAGGAAAVETLPFHHRAATVAQREQQDLDKTEAARRELEQAAAAMREAEAAAQQALEMAVATRKALEKAMQEELEKAEAAQKDLVRATAARKALEKAAQQESIRSEALRGERAAAVREETEKAAAVRRELEKLEAARTRAEEAVVAQKRIEDAAAVRREADALYLIGLELERRGDLRAALEAYHEAADASNPLAKKKLGDIFGTGSDAVERDYQTSLKWYWKARQQGVEIRNGPIPYPGIRP